MKQQNLAGQTLVIKIGGEIIKHSQNLHHFCMGIRTLLDAHAKVVLVHGGGIQVSEWATKLNHEPTMMNGRRITDAFALDLVKMVIAGKINIELVSLLQQMGIAAAGLTGVDGNLLHACRRKPQVIKHSKSQQEEIIDFGFVGDIITVNPALLTTLLHHHIVPVISPLASDSQGSIYNINGDTAASAIAVALKANRWIIATNVDGILDDKNQVIPHLSCHQAQALVQEGIITGGMIPKIESIITALQAGIKSVHIINGFRENNLCHALIEPNVSTAITLN